MIIPSILTDNPRIADERLHLAQQMSGWVHVDALDNTLYKYEALPLESLATRDFGSLSVEVHCMTDDPEHVLETGLTVDRLIIHAELPNWQEIYERLTQRGSEVWLAIAPETALASLTIPDDCGGLLVMGVIPGKSGQSILPQTFDRIQELREYYPDIPITVDGGVTVENIRELLACGADNFIAGNAIFGSQQPIEAYEKLVAVSDPIGGIYDRQSART